MQKLSLESQLGIMLITYNRASYLKKTFAYLQKTPFINCSITVFDNHSTDETSQVCEEVLQENIFKNMKVVRLPQNIGGNANILHALQSAEFNYTWILCDDDYIEPDGWEDVIEEICQGEVQSILLNVIITHKEKKWPQWNGKHFTLEDLVVRHNFYLYALGFLPCTINRLDFIRKNIAEAAMFCGFSFPHLAMHILADKNTRYYCTKNYLLLRGRDEECKNFYYPLNLYFARLCQLLEDRKMRRYAVAQTWRAYGYKTPLRLWSAEILLLGSRYHYNFSKKFVYIAEMFLFSNWLGRFCILLLFPLIFFPDAFVPMLYYVIKRKKLNHHSYLEQAVRRGRV